MLSDRHDLKRKLMINITRVGGLILKQVDKSIKPLFHLRSPKLQGKKALVLTSHLTTSPLLIWMSQVSLRTNIIRQRAHLLIRRIDLSCKSLLLTRRMIRDSNLSLQLV